MGPITIPMTAPELHEFYRNQPELRKFYTCNLRDYQQQALASLNGYLARWAERAAADKSFMAGQQWAMKDAVTFGKGAAVVTGVDMAAPELHYVDINTGDRYVGIYSPEVKATPQGKYKVTVEAIPTGAYDPSNDVNTVSVTDVLTLTRKAKQLGAPKSAAVHTGASKFNRVSVSWFTD